jgi:transitional endoplasmic reticulum ATPase
VVMASWRVLTLDHSEHDVSFEDVVELMDAAGTAAGAAYSRSDVIEALHEHEPAVVALGASSELVGVVVARMSGPDAHLLAFALHPKWRHLGMGSALLRAMDQEIIHRGARRLVALVRAGQVGEEAFANQGFTHLDGLHLYLRDASMVPEDLARVERYGGGFVDPGLWHAMKGFSATKELLERRVVEPLRHTDLANQLGLVPPGAILLFGPPGTGKTSFARAIASRLNWVFAELHPSLLGQGTEGAAALRVALSDLQRVDRLVCFIDEADEIAADRAGRPQNQPLVNELLKAIPTFKSRPGRLMVMATNSIAAIDSALLRPGRIDLVIPIGAPDDGGRAELAAEFLPGADSSAIAGRTAGFTPADFALVAQRSAQFAFDRALAGGHDQVDADDIDAAIDATRASVNSDAAARFAEEASTYARL